MPATTPYDLSYATQMEAWTRPLLLFMFIGLSVFFLLVLTSSAKTPWGQRILTASSILAVAVVATTLIFCGVCFALFDASLGQFRDAVSEDHGINLTTEQGEALYKARGQFANGLTVAALVPGSGGTDPTLEELSLVPRTNGNYELMKVEQGRLVPLTTSSG